MKKNNLTSQRINTKREHPGNKKLSRPKRDSDQMVLLILECLKDQSMTGAVRLDVMYRCELNYYYGKQLLEHCLSNGLIHKQDPYPYDSEDNDWGMKATPIEECHTRYFITQKGDETRQRLREQLAALGYEPRINRNKQDAHFSES